MMRLLFYFLVSLLISCTASRHSVEAEHSSLPGADAESLHEKNAGLHLPKTALPNKLAAFAKKKCSTASAVRFKNKGTIIIQTGSGHTAAGATKPSQLVQGDGNTVAGKYKPVTKLKPRIITKTQAVPWWVYALCFGGGAVTARVGPWAVSQLWRRVLPRPG